MILPDLSELSALRGAVKGLSLHARRPVMASLQGVHRSAQRGLGLEFEEVRAYVEGDDARSIDWRVSARRGKLHTRLYREERERPAWLIADLHPGLYFGSRRQLKSSLLLRCAAMLAWAAAEGGDRVGAVIANGTLDPVILPPRGRKSGVLPILNALVESQPKEPGAVKSNLQQALAMLRPMLKPGSMIFLLSDFADFPEAAENMLGSTVRHSDCRMLWITDALEISGLPRGNFRVGLPGRLWWMNGDQSLRPWQDAWRAREQRLNDLSLRLDLPLIRLDTQDIAAERMAALLKEPGWAR